MFLRASVSLSLDGETFYSSSVKTISPDHSDEASRNVTVAGGNGAGTYLRLELYFQDVWILISEVSFDLRSASEEEIAEAQKLSLKNSSRVLKGQMDEAKRRTDVGDKKKEAREGQYFEESTFAVLRGNPSRM